MTTQESNCCNFKDTINFKKKINCNKDFFKISHQKLYLSSIGLGMYRGNQSDDYKKIIHNAISNGLNVFDTARKYRNGLSEKQLGTTLNDLINKKKCNRGSLFLSSKAGLICFPKNINYKNYIDEILIRKRGVNQNSIINNISCFDEKFIDQEINISLENMKIKTLDNYYLHNPEFLLHKNKQNYSQFYKLFEKFEKSCSENKIKAYGISSWAGFRRFGNSKFTLNIKKILKIARDVGGSKHNFKNLQIPLSICMPFTLLSYKKKFFEYLYYNKVNIFTSGSLYEGNIINFINMYKFIENSFNKIDNETDTINNIKSFPLSDDSFGHMIKDLITLYKNKFKIEKFFLTTKNRNSIYLKSLNIIRSTNYVLSSLCGMEKNTFLKNNLKIKNTIKFQSRNFWRYYK
jgi:aryl-alcohol dehydrogenase-like predicted oxidoreductase